MMKTLFENLRDFARNEQGVATVEFVTALPMLLVFVYATFDSGLVMAKYVTLENALDRSIRQVRLGGITGGQVGSDYFKSEVCSRAELLVTDCSTNLFIEMIKVDSGATFSPPASTTCVNRSAGGTPATSFAGAAPNDVIYLRACLVVDRIFPSALSGLFAVDASGGILLVADSAYVVEPS
jgi:hypothetical protein